MQRHLQQDRTAVAVDRCWLGRTDPPTVVPGAHEPHEWRGPHIESVCDQMNRALGPVPESEYIIQES